MQMMDFSLKLAIISWLLNSHLKPRKPWSFFNDSNLYYIGDAQFVYTLREANGFDDM